MQIKKNLIYILMLNLTLIRHAKSSWDDPSLDDFDRPLNKRGLFTAPLVAQKLKIELPMPDLILCSPAKRAIQTADFFKSDKSIFEIKENIYFVGLDEILEIIKQINPSHSNVWLFGHEPHLSELVEFLTGESIKKFPTCAVFQISFTAKKWTNIKEKSGKIIFSLIPKDFIPRNP